MVIEDKELLELFKAESEEYIQELEQGLLKLERAPEDQDNRERLFRDAHSLKGAARILGLVDIETVSHQLEDYLRKTYREGLSVSLGDINNLYTTLDVIKSLVEETITGRVSNIDIEQARNILERGAQPPSAATCFDTGEYPTQMAGASGADMREARDKDATATPTPGPAVSLPDQSAVPGMQTIGDPEMLALFKAESEECLQNLETGLLIVHDNPTDMENLKTLFRSAHSLNGTARIMDLSDIEHVSGKMEALLRGAYKQHEKLDDADLDELRSLLGSATRLVDAVLKSAQPDGDSCRISGIPATEVGEQVATAPGPEQAEVPGQKAIPEQTATVTERPSQPENAVTAATHGNPDTATASSGGDSAQQQTGKFRIETIRVQPKQLDALMTHSGELSVTKTRIVRRISELENILRDWRDYGDIREKLVKQHAENEPVVTAGTSRLSDDLLGRERRAFDRLNESLENVHHELSEDQSRLDAVASRIEEGVASIRMLPLSNLFKLFPRMVRDIAIQQGKEVRLVTEGANSTVDKQILEELKSPLTHLIRNSINHGIELPIEREKRNKGREGKITLAGYQTAAKIIVEVADDGRGIDADEIKKKASSKKLLPMDELDGMSEKQLQSLVFLSGFSTQEMITDISGRGVGMDVVRDSVERIKGQVFLESVKGQGCTVRIELPMTLATSQVLLARSSGWIYGIPMEYVQTTVTLQRSELFSVEGCDTLVFNGDPISVISLSEVLKNSSTLSHTKQLPVEDSILYIVVKAGEECIGIVVDSLIGEQEVVIKPAGALLKRVPNVSGACILATGEICMILNPPDLIRSVLKMQRAPSVSETRSDHREEKTVLLAEDSIITRVQEKRILEAAGYKVIAAVDGHDAFEKLQSNRIHALVSDVNMPRMSGFDLTGRIRSEEKYKDLPVILVTTLSRDEDRMSGLEAGANAFITKGTFEQSVLLDTLERLIGKA